MQSTAPVANSVLDISGTNAKHEQQIRNIFFSDCHLTTQLCLLRYANDSEEERCHLTALQEKRKQVLEKQRFLFTFATQQHSSEATTSFSRRLKHILWLSKVSWHWLYRLVLYFFKTQIKDLTRQAEGLRMSKPKVTKAPGQNPAESDSLNGWGQGEFKSKQQGDWLECISTHTRKAPHVSLV